MLNNFIYISTLVLFYVFLGYSIIIIETLKMQWFEVFNMNTELDFKKIGSRIQKCRTEKKLTQAKLAEAIDTNQKHLSRIEGGYHRCSLDTIVALARALDVSVDYLVADFHDSTNTSTLQVILDDIRGMNPKQLEMLQENIKTIKKFNQ